MSDSPGPGAHSDSELETSTESTESRGDSRVVRSTGHCGSALAASNAGQY